MRQTSKYKTVDELPDLLNKAKQPEYKSVDELPDLKKKEPSDNGLKEPLDGGLDGTTPKTEPIPTVEMYNTPSGDLIEDPFTQVKKAKELSAKTKVVSIGNVGGAAMGTTGSQTVPDEEAVKEAKSIQEELKRTGYKEDFFAGISDLPEDAYNNPTTSKETLSILYNENPVKFTQLTNEAKNKYAIRDAAAKKAYDEAQGDDKQKTEYASRVGILKGNEYSGDEIAPPENMQQFYDIVRQKQQLIDQNIDSPEEKKKAHERLRQTYAQAINPTSLDFREEYENSGLADKLDVNQYAGLKTLELFEPEKAKVLKGIVEANITPQWNVNVQVTPEEQVRSIVTDSAMAEKMGGTLSQLTVNQRIGKEEALRELSLLGATNEYDSIVSEQNDLKNKYKEAQTDEEKANIYAKMLLNEQRANDLQKTEAKNDERYPITAKLKMDNLVKKIVQDRGIGVGGWMYNKYAHGVGSGVDAVENLITSIFGSEKEKTDLRMKRIGEGKQFEASIYLPESERGINSPVIIQASDELKKKAKEILNGRSLSELSPDEKDKLSQLVASNQDQIKTITNPEAGKSKNFWSKATGMTIAGFTADMGSFLTKMGLMQGVGMGAKAAEATTLFMDGYEPAFNKKLAEGASVEAANEYGILHGAILSLMSKFGSKYETIKNVVKGGSSPISKYIAGLSEESWNKLAAESKPLLSKVGAATKNVVKEQGKMIGTFGVAAPVASALADNLFYDEGRSVKEIADEVPLIAKEMAIGGIGFGLFGLAKGVMKTKATPVEKAALFEMADFPELGKMRIDEAVKNREISKEEGERKKGIIDNVSRLVEQVPEVNDKGKPLNDQQRANYLFNLAVKESQKEKAKTLPEKQAEEAKQKALVADKENQIELEALTEKQLNDRKDKLEKAISKLDEKGKPELSDKEMADAKAELQAVENIIKSKGDTSKTEEKLPKLSEPIEGTDEYGVSIGEDVPAETKPLTKEAEDLLASIGEGSKPTFITKNLERIAKENGIEVTDKMSADDVINALKEKQGKPTDVVGSEILKGVDDKMRQTKLEMEFKDGDALSFKNNDIEIVVHKPLGADGKWAVDVSEKSDSNTGFTGSEGKSKLFDTKLEALDYAKEQKEKSLSENKPIVNEAKETEIPISKEEGSVTEVEPVGEGIGNEDWTHINKKDITDAEDLASKHPFGESESWKNSVKKGLEKLAKIAKEGESLYDVAKNKVNEWAAKVKQEILDDGKSTFNPSDEEIAQMAYHRTMTNKKISELEPDLTSPIQAVRNAAEIVLSDLEAQKEMVDYVLHNTATTAGRAFNIRQMVSNIDAENGLQVKRMDIIRKQKGQPLSEKQEQEIRDIHDEEIKNQKAKDEYAQKKAQQDFEEAVKAEVDRRMKAKKDKAASDKVNKTPTEKRAKIADKLNEWADKFEKFGRADLPDGTVKNSLGPDVQKMVSNAMRFVAEGVRDGKNIPEILKDAVKKFGESVLDHIKGGLRDIGITDREIEGDRQYALNEIKKLADKEKSDMLTKSAVGKGLVRELVNSHIDNGLTGKDVFTELNKDLKEIFPEITEQQVRDAYLKEGEFTLDKKENINKAKVDAKNELRSIAKNETDIADLKAERDLRKREREERQKTDYENKLIAEKKELVDKKALTERQEKRLVELNKELDRIKQRKEKDAKVSNPKDLNRSDKEKAVLEEIKKEKEDWAKEKQAQRDLEFAAKKAQTAAKNEAERLKALTEKRDKLEKGQRDAPQVSTPKIESPAIEQVKAEIKEADKKLRYAESEANRLNKEMQAKRDKLAEHEANIKRAEKGLESIKTNRKKSDRQIDKEISDAETRLKKELNKKGLKLEKGSKAEREQKQKVADSHNQRTDKLIEGIDTKLQDDTLTEQEKTALENAKKILEKSKINPDSKLDIFDAVDKAEKNTELARAELANSNKLADIKHEISRSQIQMGKDKLQTEQDILLQRHKDNLQKKIDENERKLESGEYVEKEPARLKTSDAESIKLEIKDRETRNKLNAVGKAAQRAAMTKREKAIDTLQSLYVIGLVGRLSTLAKVGVSAITKQPLNTITSQTFGRLGGVLFPKIENALRGEGMESWRKEKNRYRAHYGALGERGMTKLIQKGKENAQKADENYINAKDKLEDLKNQFGEDSKQYKDFANGEFKKAENAQKQALLDNVTNSLYEWIGGNSWADAAEVFLHSSAKLEQLLGKGEKEMWADKTRKEKIMFVLSTSAATHGALKNFSARAEFAANFVARLENKMKQGIDISSAEEILKTVNESYIAFQRGKYQEDNAITGGFKAGLEGLQRWAERHPDYKYAADLMAGALKFKNPIVRTPVNIAREAIVEYTLGVPLAIAKYRNSLKDAKVDAKQFDLAGQEMKDHMKKFMDNLSPDKADFIYRAFRKGGFGLGVMALTAMGGIQFGGFFNRDERRRKKGDDLGINEVAIGGQKLTHLQAKIFEHTSAFFPALLWSNWDRVRDENLKAGHGELGANLDAAMKDFQGMMDQIPIGNEMQNPLQGVQIPLIGPFLTEYAEATDVDANGEPIKRSPKGNPLEKVWQNIEMKIPGLRQNVPIRGSKSSEFSPEELKDQTFKFFNDKGINFPELNPEKIQTKEVNGKVIEKLSDYDTKIQEDFIKKKKEYLKQEFLKLKNGTIKVYVDNDGNATTTPSRNKKLKPFNQLTKEQIQNVISTSISGNVTEKVKKEVLKDKKPKK